MNNFTTARPTRPGPYIIRDRVFGWRAEVDVKQDPTLGLVVYGAGGMVSMDRMSNWIQWKEVRS